MKKFHRSIGTTIAILILLLPTFLVLRTSESSTLELVPAGQSLFKKADVPDDPIPLNRLTVVNSNPDSYIDDFSYMASIPSSVYYDGDSKYISPLIFNGNSDSERWLIEDWVEYVSTDGGLSELITIGDFSSNEILEIQGMTGTKAYPQISGSSSAEIAAKIAVNDWRYSDNIVLALSKDLFSSPTITSDSATYSFTGASLSSYDTAVTISSTTTTEIPFTPPGNVGWMGGAFNWTGNEIFTHELEDPLGRAVDYSIYTQVSRERSISYVDNPLPLFFWYPYTTAGEWSFIMEPRSQISRDIEINCSVTYYPGFTETITVPANAKWLNITTLWDNAGTTINIALVDPTGRLVMWSPAESLLGGAGSKSMQMPYPSAGDWTLVGAWVDVTSETNNVNIEWDIETLPSDLQPHLESAGNGAVLASLLNAPLLYVDSDSVPDITTWALEYLGATTCFLVDPANIHSTSLIDTLDDTLFVSALSSYAAVTDWIHTLSGEKDVVLTVPLGSGDEIFAPSAYSAASHGAAIFSMCGEDNVLTTRAEETWYPYMIGPEIRIFVSSDYATRAENGWYDERIPNVYSMRYSASSIESFLSTRGAYNASESQSIIIVSPTDLIKTSFDRSLQSRFACGRIPAASADMASVMITKACLHRFLFRTAANANDALLSLYAYTYSAYYSDNFGNTYTIQQIENTVSALESADFTIDPHVGVNEIFSTLASQVALWSFSTHGTLTEFPTDPPQRPDGLGVFSVRDVDIPYGQESDIRPDYDNNSLVNPVLYSPELNNHILRTTIDLENAIDNIGSPIVILTACLLGGTGMPEMLMKHGAVAVTAAPRTVYFRAAGLLSILFSQAITAGNTTGDALASALRSISHDYTDPLSFEPRDYANQQILYGDPDICLYHPTNDPRIASVDPDTITIDGHTPSRGVKDVAGLGTTDYLPNGFDAISVEYDYYQTNNYTDFLRILDLRTTVVIEPQVLNIFEATISDEPSILPNFVKSGGTLIILGINEDVSWLPWDIVYVSGTTSSSATLDSSHPLLSVPNTLSSNVESFGYLTSISGNLSSIASDSNGIVMAAGIYGSGKVAVTTTNPTGSLRDEFLENAVNWHEQDSLILWEVSQSQEIIWEGDRVSFTFKLTDIGGQEIEDATVNVIVNSTSVAVDENLPGRYTILLDEAWTSVNAGQHSIFIHATKAGYDTLTLELQNYLFIRTSPILLVLIGGGVVVTLVIAWQYRKRKYGDSSPKVRRSKAPRETKEERKKRELAEKERKRKREEADKKIDAKEFFGVD